MKRTISLILLLTMLFSIGSISANATVMKPEYTYICDVENCLEPSGNTLYFDAATSGYFNATRCGVTATLQKQSGSSWSNYRVWSKSSNSDYVLFSTSINVSSGRYRLVTSHSVTVGSSTEYEGMTSDDVDV
jgi:hypothetical protein